MGTLIENDSSSLKWIWGESYLFFFLLRKVTDFSLICWIYYYFSTGSDYYYRVWAQSHSCTRCHPGYRGWAWRNDLRGHQPGQQGSCPHYWSPWQGNPQDHGWVQGEATEDSSVLGLWLLMLDYKICALIAGRTRISYFSTIPQPHWFATLPLLSAVLFGKWLDTKESSIQLSPKKLF